MYGATEGFDPEKGFLCPVFSVSLDKDKMLVYIYCMPVSLNPVRKAILKKELLNPKNSIRDALLKAGYAPSTAARSGGVQSVKISKMEIQEDIKKLITVDKVLKGLEEIRTAAYKDKDYSTATRCEELQGRYLAMFTDRREEIVLNAEEKDTLRPRLAEILARIKTGGE